MELYSVFCNKLCWGGFPDGQKIKNLPVVQETWVWSRGWEDAQQRGMAAYSSVFAWRIPWTEEPGRLQSMGSQTVRHTTNTHAHIHTVEKNLKKYMYVNHFAVHLKWCKSTILQLKNSWAKRIYCTSIGTQSHYSVKILNGAYGA